MSIRISQDSKQKHMEGYLSNIVLAAQENVWFNEEIMLDWIESCWKKEVAKHDKQIYYLLLDSFSVHMTQNSCVAFCICSTELDYIPEGYSSGLQVMDSGVSKPLNGAS
jgi:DDE superfamily endonuclease